MQDLFFNPIGTLGEEQFYKGAVILLALNFFLWPLWYLGTAIGMTAGFLSLCTIFPWFCLFAKRLRAAGYSPWAFLMLWGSFITATTILIFFTTALRLGARANADPDLMARMEAIQTMDRDNPDNELVLSVYSVMGDVIIIPSAIIFFLVGISIVRVFNKTLSTRS